MSDEKRLSQLELKPCTRCGNPFMVKRGGSQQRTELVCDNCIKLEQRKRELQVNVMDNVIQEEGRMTEYIREMKNELTVTKGKFNKQFFLDNIKKRAQALSKSIELLEQIEDTNDEKFVDNYKKLFDKMKRDLS